MRSVENREQGVLVRVPPAASIELDNAPARSTRCGLICRPWTEGAEAWVDPQGPGDVGRESPDSPSNLNKSG
jgi:hypothetical protein